MAKSNIKIDTPVTQEGKPAPIEKEIGQLSLDIFHTDSEIIILAPIAGVKADDVTLSITDDVLVIKGLRTPKFDISEENYYTKECFWGHFSRSIVLPIEADVKDISANFKNGILEIHIPRIEVKKTNIIKING